MPAAVVEAQGDRQRVEHLRGGRALPPPLEAYVVVDADPREQRHFLTPQAWHPPVPRGREIHLGRSHAGAPGGEVVTEF